MRQVSQMNHSPSLLKLYKMNEINKYEKVMGPELGAAFNHLNNEVIWLNMNWHNYLELFDSGEETISLLNYSAPQFFFLLKKGILENIIISIGRIFDNEFSNPVSKNKKSNLSLVFLINSLYDDDKKIKLLKKLNFTKTTYYEKTIKTYRNEWFAHKDLEFSLRQKTNNIYPVKMELQRIVDEVSEIMNIIYQSYFDSQLLYNYKHSKNAQALVHILKSHRCIMKEIHDLKISGEIEKAQFLYRLMLPLSE